jgi:RHS repeat-associated protein
LVSASDGAPTTRYEYGPFGEAIRVTGPAAALNPFRFSTKRTDNTTDLILYEHRAYSPVLGRWLSRDPIWEPGFNVRETRWHSLPRGNRDSVYCFVANGPLNGWDFLGLICATNCGCDLTELVKKTLQEVEDTYKNRWTITQRYSACNSLDSVTTGMTAWDMEITAPTPSTTGPCTLTATFEGKCYKTSAINYALFGKISRLCFDSFGTPLPGARWSLEYSIGLAQIHKWVYCGDFSDEANQAFAFISYGFGSALSYNGRDYALGLCQASKAKCRGEQYRWKWAPNKKDF